MKKNSGLKAIYDEVEAQFRAIEAELPANRQDLKIEVELKVVEPDGTPYVPEDHEFTATLREGQREIYVLEEAQRQYEAFFKQTGMRANAAARRALTRLIADPHRPVQVKSISLLWNSRNLNFEDNALRFSPGLSRLNLSAGLFFLTCWAVVVAAIGIGLGQKPVNMQMLYAFGGLGTMMTVAFVWVWREFFMPYILSKRIAPALERIFGNAPQDAPPRVPADKNKTDHNDKAA